MINRKDELLRVIVEDYIKTARPVGSSVLVEKYDFNVSPATIRNDMAELEEDGLIAQPHTSAGRIPTEKGYQYYIENFLQKKKPSNSAASVLKRAVQGEYPDFLKNIARASAKLSHETIFIGFGRHDCYYTGISYLLSKPEFADPENISNIARVVDHFDDVIDDILYAIQEGPHVFIGTDNPFSDNCSVIITEFESGKKSGIFGILGPMRMDYDKNIALIKAIKELISIN